MPRDPFTPTFGVSPPLLIGRDDLIAEFATSLADDRGSSTRATIYTGSRGIGKTTMLNVVERVAREHGWLVISETAYAGFVDWLTNIALSGLLASHGYSNTTASTQSFGDQLKLVSDHLRSLHSGVLITLDELNDAQFDELREFGAALYQAFPDNGTVAFVGAGLPRPVNLMLADLALANFQQADLHVLEPVDLDDAKRALRVPTEDSAREIEPLALDDAARATEGYPFLIQLLGHLISHEHPDERVITRDDVASGVLKMHERIGSWRLESELTELSENDRVLLVAMATDHGPSKTSAIASRLAIGQDYLDEWLAHLIERGVIYQTRHGEVDFVQPLLREYLRVHPVSPSLEPDTPWRSQ
ncbi:ATP-binding protein [Ferrimicrobium acidiphilum]